MTSDTSLNRIFLKKILFSYKAPQQNYQFHLTIQYDKITRKGTIMYGRLTQCSACNLWSHLTSNEPSISK